MCRFKGWRAISLNIGLMRSCEPSGGIFRQPTILRLTSGEENLDGACKAESLKPCYVGRLQADRPKGQYDAGVRLYLLSFLLEN